jgi:hypothetical protein
LTLLLTSSRWTLTVSQSTLLQQMLRLISYNSWLWAVQTLAMPALINFTSQAGTGAQAVTGAGFKPDAIMLLGADAPSGAGSGIACFGMGVSSTKRGATSYGYDGGTQVSTYLSTAKVFSCHNPATGAIRREADLTSLDTDGFTVNWSTAVTGQTIYALCLKGGQYSVGNITQKTSTGSQATSGVGFQLVGLFLQSAMLTATSTVLIASMVGAGSGSSARGVTSYQSGATGTDSHDRTHIYIAYADDGTPTLNGRADLTSLDADGFTLNYGTADAVARQILYLAFGSSASSGSVAAAAGTSTATAVGSSTAASPASTAGTSTATAVGTSQARSVGGAADGVGAATAVGSSQVAL